MILLFCELVLTVIVALFQEVTVTPYILAAEMVEKFESGTRDLGSHYSRSMSNVSLTTPFHISCGCMLLTFCYFWRMIAVRSLIKTNIPLSLICEYLMVKTVLSTYRVGVRCLIFVILGADSSSEFDKKESLPLSSICEYLMMITVLVVD